MSRSIEREQGLFRLTTNKDGSQSIDVRADHLEQPSDAYLLGVREPTPLQRWAASRWDKPKDARPSVEEVKGLLRGIRKTGQARRR